VDWNAFFGALDEIDYRGFCSVEFESFAYLERVLKGDAEAAARLSFEQIAILLDA
jgi:sugar phosphate isomerase/epimerase